MYFDASEEKDFIEYLDHKLEDYFVIEYEKKVVGSGGINYFPSDHVARISWDMVHPNFHGKGFGKKLMLHRIDHIKRNKAIHKIQVRTSQLAYQFYQKTGFTLEKIEKDFWATGFDLYQMNMTLK